MMSRYLNYISVIFAFFGVGVSSFLHAQAPVITSTASPINAVVGSSYTYEITANNGPIDEYLAYNLPSWLNLNSDTGSIIGTPEQSDLGEVSFDVGATRLTPFGYAALLTVNFDVVLEDIPVTEPPVLTSVTSTKGWVGQSFSYELEFSNQVDTLEEVGGITEFSDLAFNPITGVLSGIPSVERWGKVYFQATNIVGTSTFSLYLDVQDAPVIQFRAPFCRRFRGHLDFHNLEVLWGSWPRLARFAGKSFLGNFPRLRTKY